MKINLSYNKIGVVITLALILVFSPFLVKAAALTRQLQLGMSGSDVSSLQIFLAQDRTIYPQGLITGYFGSLTRAAVIRFQARNSISTVGRVGPITLAAINAQMGAGIVGSIDNQRVIGPLSVNVSNSQATIAWNTSEGSSAAVYYSLTPFVLTEATDFTPFMISGGSNIVLHSDLRTSHAGTVTGLSPNTNYYYMVYVKDIEGNESITLPSTFRTLN